MALEMGSVVVPFLSDTTAISWPVTALTTLDFPAFRRPKKPICILFAEGVSFSPITVLLFVVASAYHHSVAYLLHLLFQSQQAGGGVLIQSRLFVIEPVVLPHSLGGQVGMMTLAPARMAL